ncbi:HsdM family class I SAM-dependent methyltransferase [Vibrio crassostreae]|uniref:HsdM family class I SAM-dependent methyltransferase n=1 Tax=Vibrio crassostreae TaxID=246167 RepID=UPI001049863F|nr:N-6 DNA methylase [Vibrio crassostreae]TCW19108.1 type I restriction enzyme M protein [Vibrio crassostreae]
MTTDKKLTKAQQAEIEQAKEAQALLEANTEKLASAYNAKGFNQQAALNTSSDDQTATLVFGKNSDGMDTHRVLLWVLAEGQWQLANADDVEQAVIDSAGSLADEEFPKFVHVSDGKNEKLFEMDFPPQEVDQIPDVEDINKYTQIKRDPTYYWSREMYDRLMKGLNAFHERVYTQEKDNVSNKNEIIEEVSKFLFLETFRIHHTEQTITHDEQSLVFKDVFDWRYIEQHKEVAVKQIKAAFNELKKHADYVVTDDAGEKHPIFDDETHLRLAKPGNYLALMQIIQDLPGIYLNAEYKKPSSDRAVIAGKEHPNLGHVAADVLGRVFDVFLRANFESKGGMGVYLTPAPVKQCMLQMAMHDILEESPEILNTKGSDNKPVFRFCDPTCGSYGFGSIALGHVERALMEVLGAETADDVRRHEHFQAMLEHSFTGADAAPLMVKLARVNMAMLGAPKANIFKTDNSLTTSQLHAGSFDLICTNPPFGKSKSSITEILEQYITDLHESPKGKGWIYKPTVYGRALGGQPDSKDRWKLARNGLDMAVLFIDRCLELLKPGGRLLMVLPDGILCNSGDRYVREYIMGKKDETTGKFSGGKAIIKAVVSLPSDTFSLSGTGAKTSILYLQKRDAHHEDEDTFANQEQGDVFMAVADTLGYIVKKNVEDYSTGVPNDLAAISGAYVRGE